MLFRSYAGATSFYKLVDAVRDVYGYEELIPTHQGRGAEHILSQLLISPGDVVPGNMYFTTTRYHQEAAGGRFQDVIVDEAHDPTSMFPFKGNIDLDKLKAIVEEVGADRVPYVSFETNVNMAGGQPASMENIKKVYAYCRTNGIAVMLDATRAVENAYFIQEREDGYQDRSIAEILREITDHSDGATVSSKKDNLVNIGGFLAVRDPELARRARAMLVAFEAKKMALAVVSAEGAVSHGLLERILQAGYGVTFYLAKTLVPTNLVPLYPLERTFESPALVDFAGVAFVVGTSLVLIALRRRAPALLGAWIAYGALVGRALEAAHILAEDGLDVTVINARFAQPLDADAVAAAEKPPRLEWESVLSEVNMDVWSELLGKAP